MDYLLSAAVPSKEVPYFCRIATVVSGQITTLVRLKCRQVPSPLFSNHTEASPAVGECRQKNSTNHIPLRQLIWMFHLPFHFVRDDQELNARFFPSSSRRVRIAAAWAP